MASTWQSTSDRASFNLSHHGLLTLAFSNGRPIVDRVGRVWGVFGGRPPEDNFMRDVHDPAVEAMERARAECSISDDHSFHRRGNYWQLTAGGTLGPGQLEPGTLVNGVINTAVLCSLLSHLSFIRWAGFATGEGTKLPLFLSPDLLQSCLEPGRRISTTSTSITWVPFTRATPTSVAPS